jgi:hypothetical protein
MTVPLLGLDINLARDGFNLLVHDMNESPITDLALREVYKGDFCSSLLHHSKLNEALERLDSAVYGGVYTVALPHPSSQFHPTHIWLSFPFSLRYNNG